MSLLKVYSIFHFKQIQVAIESVLNYYKSSANGVKTWEKYNEFKLEYMDLDEFLTENELPSDTCQQEQQFIDEEKRIKEVLRQHQQVMCVSHQTSTPISVQHHEEIPTPSQPVAISALPTSLIELTLMQQSADAGSLTKDELSYSQLESNSHQYARNKNSDSTAPSDKSLPPFPTISMGRHCLAGNCDSEVNDRPETSGNCRPKTEADSFDQVKNTSPFT